MLVVRNVRQGGPVLKDFVSPFDAFMGGLITDFPGLAASREMSSGTVGYDVHEDDSGITLWLDMPGVRREDLLVELKGQELTIRGERRMPAVRVGKGGAKNEGNEDTTGNERSRPGRIFQRTFTLPDGVRESDVTAKLADGVLELHIAKPEEAKPKQIAIGH